LFKHGHIQGAIMQKTLLALLMLVGSFASSHLMSANSYATSEFASKLPTKKLLAKGKQHFDVISEHHRMIFNFTIGNNGATPAGTFLLAKQGTAVATAATAQNYRVYIMTPDKRQINGPKIDVNNAPSEFSIRVDPPILDGTYTIVVKNINIPELSSFNNGILNPGVFITNSENTKIAIVELLGITTTPDNPGDTTQVTFVPTRAFFKHK
jgi:hypothetical protein